jgi:hypothetical protein
MTDTDLPRKRRRTGATFDFTVSSGVDTPPLPLQNHSLEFTQRSGRGHQTSTNTAVEESFGLEDLNLPDEPLPWDDDFHDFPLPQSEEGPHVEEEEGSEVRINVLFSWLSLLILHDR